MRFTDHSFKIKTLQPKEGELAFADSLACQQFVSAWYHREPWAL